MYSTTIKPKVDKIFSHLNRQAKEIIATSTSMNEAVARATRLVSSEVSTRSKTILSDMLDDLTNSLLETEFFADITKQNAFYRMNLQEEILSKYHFAPVPVKKSRHEKYNFLIYFFKSGHSKFF